MRDGLSDPVVDTDSAEELIDDLENSQERERDRERDSMNTSYPTPEELSSDDETETLPALVSPLTPPLSSDRSHVGGMDVTVPSSSAHSGQSRTST